MAVSLFNMYIVKEGRLGFVFGGRGMTKQAHKRTNIVGFFAIVVLSAATMLWLFWRYPLSTGIAAIAVLAAFGVCARLARSIDTEVRSELEHRKQRA
jgi:hypothetical protein